MSNNDSYPSSEDISNTDLAYLPVSLRLLLEQLFVGKDNIVKIASIRQAIMQAVRPRVLLPPLQLGLGVQMHHHFASRFLIDSLHKVLGKNPPGQNPPGQNPLDKIPLDKIPPRTKSPRQNPPIISPQTVPLLNTFCFIEMLFSKASFLPPLLDVIYSMVMKWESVAERSR